MRRSLQRGATGGGIVVLLLVAVVWVSMVPAPSSSAAIEDALPDPVLDELSLTDRAGQLVMTAVPGASLTSPSARMLRVLHPGGVIVFGDNYRSRTQLTRWLRAVQAAVRSGEVQRPAALVAIDQEGGVVRRIPHAPPSLSHEQLGRADRVGLTRAQARATAMLLKELGIHMDLAPVADLDIGPRHVMHGRSFGGSAALASRHVAAFVDGLQKEGVATSVKHFPGFGGASANSDDDLARVARTRAQLQVDLRPFRAAIAHDADAVMISHGIYTALDRRRPASTSPAAYRLLRRELGFDGVAITDSLHANGLAQGIRAGVPEGCVRSVAAGADVVLLAGTVTDAVRCRAALVAAVRSGRIPRVRLDEAVTRVLRLKAKLGLPGVSLRSEPAG